MKSIGLVLPYFGSLPNYFELFLASVRHNSEIDLLIFTDSYVRVGLPSNVKLFFMSFAEFKSILQERFDFPLTHLQSPYNLCDFKPAYGFCLEKHLSQYDYWGHCDCDLIFGDIRSFITDEILDNYDRILSGGHLSIYRNTPAINMRFMEESDVFTFFKRVYQSSPKKIWGFDESPGVNKLWRAKYADKYWWPYCYDDIEVRFGAFVPWVKYLDPENNCFIYHYRHGTLTRIRISGEKLIEESTCYIHLQKRPMYVLCNNYEDYLIIPPNKFIDTLDLDVETIKKLRQGPKIYPHYISIRYANMLKKVKSLFVK